MAVTLIGEVVNNCDAVTGFSAGNISTDDDFVEGTGAIGAKISNTYIAFYTTSLGATAPYNAASGGGEAGYHMIMYFGAKSPLDATAGQRMIVGNGTDRGEWYVPLTGKNEPKISIFVSRVIDLARDFDLIAAGTWTLAGNPAQLTNITQMGGGIQTTVSIMGSFNNGQIDQITLGLGVRADAGTIGTPNTFEIVRAQDEDTSKWGWWSSVAGAIVAKGKLFIGPATGSATSVFTDTDFSVIFAAELVAATFYEISTIGAGTDVTWLRGNVGAANPAIARWGLTIDSTTNTFSDTDGVWKGAGALVLDNSATLTNTALVDCTSLTQLGATLDGCKILDANTVTDTAFILSDNPSLISNCIFQASAGYAMRCDTQGTYDWAGHTITGYGGTPGTNLVSNSGSTDAMFYNNSGGLITLNVSGGDSPSVRNGIGATTVVNSTVTYTLNNLVAGSEVRIFNTSGTELAGVESSGTTFAYPYSYTGDVAAFVIIQRFDYEWMKFNVTLGNTSASQQVQQRPDLNAVNP